MAFEGPNLPGTAATDNAVGTVDWTNPDNIKVGTDAAAASVSLFEGNAISYYLKATNFGFTIPAGATIDGIYVHIRRRGSHNLAFRNVKDEHVRIVKADASIGAENKGDLVTKWATSPESVYYGANNDLWSEVWSAANINNANFGVVISADLFGGETSIAAYVYYIQITVYYTEVVETNMQVNISDVLKDVTEAKINIGGVLKDVTEAKINIGGVLKDIF